MSNKSPIFPMPATQLFSDYGFHPHFDYFQVVEEARMQKREKQGGKLTERSQHFKLQKPTISHEHHLGHSKMIKKNKHNNNNNRKRWWKHALHFFKGKLLTTNDHNYIHHHQHHAGISASSSPPPPPIYITESRSGSTTPCRTTRRPMSCPASPAIMRTEVDNFAYISLTDINDQHRISASSPMPIYLVT